MAASEIEKLERMVRENPKGRLFASLADAYRKDGQYPKALEVLEAGLVNHPDYVSARVVLGRVHMSTGDRAKAREAFARVVQLDPESVIALKALADLAEEEGQGEEALRWSGQLLTVDPGNDEALKQQERLAAAAPPAPAAEPAPATEPAPAPAESLLEAPPEVRLSGIVPMIVDEPTATPVADPEKTVAPFEAIKPPVLKTVEIQAVPPSGRPSFTATPAPMDQPPEPLPLSDEARTEQVASSVTPMEALEPTSFEGDASGPTQRLAGLDHTGMSAEEVAAIGAAPGFEPTSGDSETIDMPRVSMSGLEAISGELATDEPATVEVTAEPGLEREVEIELGARGSNEYQEDSVAETLQQSGGANEFQVASDGDMLDPGAAATGEAIETGGTDLAFIDTGAPESGSAPLPLIPEDPEPALTEPEPVVTESMAELYATQGHLSEALDVYRQLSMRDPGELRYQERIVELEMYVGGGAPAAPAAQAVPAPARMAAPAAPAMGETVGAWLTSVFAESLPGVTPEAEETPSQEMAPEPMAPESAPDEPMMMEPPAPAPVEPEPEILDLASEATIIPPTAPRGEPTRPASGAFNLSNVFEEPKPSKTGSFDAFFEAPRAPKAPAPAPAPEAAPGRSTRPSGAQPPTDDDISSFQDWLKGLKK